ncbi:MOSC domain-containing protein [Nitratifractor sp.]|uniref:MOSC domain-containing protein n=1 Tax=Nitratifractor sp. TaxID=2268144 RepID=UPI0025E9CD9D|nr:MOSC domain-containing protein [Nitratifractor sp.]
MIVAGKVLGTFSAPEGVSGMPRPRAETLKMVAGYGIEGDKYAGGPEHKTVMIVGDLPYKMAKEELGVEMEEGSLGENILLDFDPHEFAPGTLFRIGEAKIQIVDSCTLCKHLAVFHPKLPRLIRDRRGRYCRIVEDGEIRVGDTVIWEGREL